MSVQRCQLDALGGKRCWTYSEAVNEEGKKIKKNKKQGGKRLPFAMQAPEYRNRVGDDEYERRSIRLVRNGVGVRALQP